MSGYNQAPKEQSGNDPVHVGGDVADTLHGQSTVMQPIAVSHAQVSEQGGRAFTRADHVRQHLRSFHKHGGTRANAVSQAQRQETALMLAAEPQEQDLPDASHLAHPPDSPPPHFRCTIFGCPRVGPRGFVCEEDLNEHMLIHAPPQNSMLYQPGPADFGIFPMDNAVSQQNGSDYPQDMIYHPMGGFSSGGDYFTNGVGGLDDQGEEYGDNFGVFE
ncbi:hypothetical protein F5Y10DRAFT_284822 [Nemania abortiva]|nr:hypothetical protein F5Y10DRAFT_284822 [Nemania abortiva]